MSEYEELTILAAIFITGFMLGMLTQHWIDRALWSAEGENV